jgi:hypothetical protein
MAKSPVQKIWLNTGAVTSGTAFGFLLLSIFSVSWGHWSSRPMLYVALGMLCWLLITWAVVGARAFALILASALGTIACVLLVVYTIESVFNPDPVEARITAAKQFLAECEPHEIRLVYYDPAMFNISMRTVQLTNGAWIEREWDRRGFELTASSDAPYFHPYSPGQLKEVAGLVSSLPSPRFNWSRILFGDLSPYKFRISFYQAGWRRVFYYESDEANPQRGKLSQVLGLRTDSH